MVTLFQVWILPKENDIIDYKHPTHTEIDLGTYMLGALMGFLFLIYPDPPMQALFIVGSVLCFVIGTKRVNNPDYVNTKGMTKDEYIALMTSKGFHFSEE